MTRRLLDHSIGNLMRRGTGGGGAKMQQLLLAQFLYYANEELKKHFPQEHGVEMKALSVKNKILTILCRNSLLAQELKMKQNEILKNIQTKMPQFPVKSVTAQIRDWQADWE